MRRTLHSSPHTASVTDRRSGDTGDGTPELVQSKKVAGDPTCLQVARRPPHRTKAANRASPTGVGTLPAVSEAASIVTAGLEVGGPRRPCARARLGVHRRSSERDYPGCRRPCLRLERACRHPLAGESRCPTSIGFAAVLGNRAPHAKRAMKSDEENVGSSISDRDYTALRK